ncbi:MAG: SMC-Scp complex subunit ScpB [Phycisphaerae bacterium]
MSDTEVVQPQGTPGSPKEITTQSVVEAILFASDVPLPAAKIAQIVGAGDAREVKKHIAALNDRYEAAGAAFRIEEIAAGFQMLTLPEYNTWLSKLSKARSDSKLSQAALETLAVVAYKQPVLRADIEAIRGVAAGEMLNRLRELGLIKIVGRAEEIGRPMLYGTTRKFLEVFGLADLRELPQVEELRPPEPKAAQPAPAPTADVSAAPAVERTDAPTPAEPAGEHPAAPDGPAA